MSKWFVFQEERYRGQATTDGTFKGTRYFLCKDNCGLLVSLDKLSPDREGSTLSKPPPGGQEHARSAGGTQVPQRPPRPDRNHPPSAGSRPDPRRPLAPDPGIRGHPMATRKTLEGETDLDAPQQPQFATGDRVVVYTKKGSPVFGEVRWTGKNKAKRDLNYYVVGIETVNQLCYLSGRFYKPGMHSAAGWFYSYFAVLCLFMCLSRSTAHARLTFFVFLFCFLCKLICAKALDYRKIAIK